MSLIESQKLVSRAILLERAARAIEETYPQAVRTDITVHTTWAWLTYQARAWRKEAEHGAGS